MASSSLFMGAGSFLFFRLHCGKKPAFGSKRAERHGNEYCPEKGFFLLTERRRETFRGISGEIGVPAYGKRRKTLISFPCARSASRRCRNGGSTGPREFEAGPGGATPSQERLSRPACRPAGIGGRRALLFPPVRPGGRGNAATHVRLLSPGKVVDGKVQNSVPAHQGHGAGGRCGRQRHMGAPVGVPEGGKIVRQFFRRAGMAKTLERGKIRCDDGQRPRAPLRMVGRPAAGERPGEGALRRQFKLFPQGPPLGPEFL